MHRMLLFGLCLVPLGASCSMIPSEPNDAGAEPSEDAGGDPVGDAGDPPADAGGPGPSPMDGGGEVGEADGGPNGPDCAADCPLLELGFEQELATVEGCDDANVNFTDDDDSIVVSVWASHVLHDTWRRGLTERTVSYQLPHDDARVWLHLGDNLQDSYCREDHWLFGPTVAYDELLAGQLTMTVRDVRLDSREPWPLFSGVASVRLEGVKLQTADGESVLIPLLEASDVALSPVTPW